MNARVLPAGTNIIAEAASLLEPSGQDFSGDLVVFPGRRPAHFLRREIALQIGSAFIPPGIHSIDGFVDQLYDASFERRKIDVMDASRRLIQLRHYSHATEQTYLGWMGRFFSYLNGVGKSAPDGSFNITPQTIIGTTT